ASGTLSIKTPDQKLGGNVTIASDATLTIAKTVTTTTTGVITGGGKLVIGDGSTASSVTLVGTLGTVTGEGESAQATCALALEVAAASELCLTPTLATTLSASVTGAGKLVIGDGSSATQVTQAAVGCDISAIDITAGATYTVSTDGDSSHIMLPATTTVMIAENGKLCINTVREMDANVTGAGEVEIAAATTYVFKENQTNCLAPGKLTLTRPLTLKAERAGTGLSVDALCVQAALTSTSSNGVAEPVVTVATGKVLSGSGSIAAPIVFKDGAIFDAERLPEGNYLNLKDATITWPEESGTVTVKTSKTTQLILFKSKVGVSHFTLVNTGDDTGLYLYEGTYGSTSMLNVLKKMDSAALPTEIAGNEAVKEAIQAGIEKWTENGIIITEIKAATAQSTARVAQGSVQALDCFTNLETTVNVAPDWEGGDFSKGIATVTYDFGVADMTIRDLQLGEDSEEKRYVLLAAQVRNSVESNTADFASGTTLSVLNGETPITSTEVSAAVAGAAETLGVKWLAVPFEVLFPAEAATGTRALKVKVSKVTTN
ncbi:MAG: hypothetical protein ACI4YA_05130, partial [Candidatus Spyradenecus sp.]